jgi:hypothetical protein
MKMRVKGTNGVVWAKVETVTVYFRLLSQYSPEKLWNTINPLRVAGDSTEIQTRHLRNIGRDSNEVPPKHRHI